MKQANDKALLFMMYTTLYSNDMICNCIKELSPYISTRDKETRKIYGALMKRVSNYFKETNKLLGDSSYFLADFSSYLDEHVDDSLNRLKDLICDKYTEAGISDADFLSRLEVARSMCSISIENIDYIQKQLVKEKFLPKRFEYGNFLEIFKILNNLCLWSYRHVDKQQMVNFSKEELCNSINSVIGGIFDIDIFNEAYSYAARIEKEDKDAR